MTNLYNHIKDLLSQNESYCKDGKFFKNVIVEAALQLNPDLLKLIISDDKAKALQRDSKQNELSISL